METNFQPWEFPRSGSKAKDGERKKKKKKKLKVGNNNGQLSIANATSGYYMIKVSECFRVPLPAHFKVPLDFISLYKSVTFCPSWCGI